MGLKPSNILAWTSNLPNHEREDAFLFVVGCSGSHRNKLRPREGQGKEGEKLSEGTGGAFPKMKTWSRCEIVVFLKRQSLQRASLKLRRGQCVLRGTQRDCRNRGVSFALVGGTQGS